MRNEQRDSTGDRDQGHLDRHLPLGLLVQCPSPQRLNELLQQFRANLSQVLCLLDRNVQDLHLPIRLARLMEVYCRQCLVRHPLERPGHRPNCLLHPVGLLLRCRRESTLQMECVSLDMEATRKPALGDLYSNRVVVSSGTPLAEDIVQCQRNQKCTTTMLENIQFIIMSKLRIQCIINL